ncbi:MAG: class I SAM-dependent methyltransferase, partial [Thermomicrobiales bacterium]|nr:class I SAM-dependent methyltransferase [Thermomicrobiales bacterium]
MVESAAEAVQLARIAGIDERSASVFQQLLDELWAGENPFLFADPRQVDGGYPNSNIQPDLIDAILREAVPRFWLEIGTMLGGSAIMTAERVKALGLETTICCVDPFTGDANMWSWERARREAGEWRYLKLEAGRPTIYERFLANVRAAGHEEIIVPIVCTSLVGIRLLEFLLAEGRLHQRPEVIYLDSAHEPGETLLELQRAWELLAPGGILFGDDWLWPSVRHDVQAFAQGIVADGDRTYAFMRQFVESELEGAVLLYR